ncbi:DUF2231 domain-containing protein [Rubrivirga sp. IMCC43871]|uniref:DUF2231 domain-containing protein n=1 Tax=Rubrivirga sp. IMCC43871 TaxID=3391575 RepID=UPI0039903668
MDLIAQYEIPFLHPLLVHFPLVLILLGAGAATMYLVFGRGVWRQAALVFFVFGAAGAWAAAETGHDLEQAVEGDPIVEQVVERHEQGADWTIWLSVAAALAFGVASVARIRRPQKPEEEGEETPVKPRSRREALWGRLLGFVLALAAAGAVAWTAHLGGIMVWGIAR